MIMRESLFKGPIIFPSNTYVVFRHGKTDWNIERRYQGHTNIPLNSDGEHQASTALIPFHPDRIFISPLLRTLQTAQRALSEHQHSFQIDERLIERDGGEFEGQLYSDLLEKDSWVNWKTADMDTILYSRFPNGESAMDVIYRIYNFISELEQSYSNEVILLVTHSGVNRAIGTLLIGSFDQVYLKGSIGNCEYKAY